MSRKRKTDIIKIATAAAFSAAVVLLLWLLRQPRFQNIAACLIPAAALALILEAAVLLALKGQKKIKRAIKILLLFAINISVFTSAVIYSFAPAVILQPHRDDESASVLQEVPLMQKLEFEGREGRISGWFYNAAGEAAPTVLYFYGNYETAATRLCSLSASYGDSAFSDCNFAVFDYPAYGNSEGKCTDDTILAFALEVYDQLTRVTDDIIVMGYSVGTGPACYLAGERDVDALILYAPYADSVDLYNNVADIFHGPLEKLVAFDIDSKKSAGRVTAPVLILASEGDELIPYNSSAELIDKFSGVCDFIRTPDITHNQFFASDFVKEKTAEFIEGVTEK